MAAKATVCRRNCLCKVVSRLLCKDTALVLPLAGGSGQRFALTLHSLPQTWSPRLCSQAVWYPVPEDCEAMEGECPSS